MSKTLDRLSALTLLQNEDEVSHCLDSIGSKEEFPFLSVKIENVEYKQVWGHHGLTDKDPAFRIL